MADAAHDIGEIDGGLSLHVNRVAAPLREQVTELLRQAIVEHRIAPGQRLIERELVERIGVSRTTIREALRQLAAEGLVTTVPQRGAIVAIPSPEEAAELYEIRAALEALAARRFIEHASELHLDALRTAFGEVSDVMSAGDHADVAALLAAKDRFYDVLLEGAGNAAVQQILAGLKARVGALRANSARQPGRVRASLDEMTVLMRAIEARDVDAAANAARHHAEMAAQAGLDGR